MIYLSIVYKATSKLQKSKFQFTFGFCFMFRNYKHSFNLIQWHVKQYYRYDHVINNLCVNIFIFLEPISHRNMICWPTVEHDEYT